MQVSPMRTSIILLLTFFSGCTSIPPQRVSNPREIVYEKPVDLVIGMPIEEVLAGRIGRLEGIRAWGTHELWRLDDRYLLFEKGRLKSWSEVGKGGGPDASSYGAWLYRSLLCVLSWVTNC